MIPSNEELAALVKSGRNDAFAKLTSAFEGVIWSIISSYNVEQEEKNDLYQEGLIALYKAALSYDSSMDTSFSTFARVCIKHSIISALRIYYGKKNYPIRSSVSLNVKDDDTTEIQGLGQVTEPEYLLIEKESYDSLLKKIDVSLSPLENSVLKLHIQGRSYGEISSQLSISTKSVDNALQRIRGKLKLLI